MREPLAVYIHWPFCKAKCPYCDFNSHVREGVDQDAWRAALLTELAFMARELPDREVSSIFFGGGTPSLMPTNTAAALIDAIAGYWPMHPDAEITLEANPTSVEAATFDGFREAGVNRVSLGVQALNEQDLRFLGRRHNAKEALAAVELAARIFPRYSFDLIYARPNQTPEAWAAELREALSYADGHLSLYQLTIEENTAFYHAYQRGDFVLPSEDVSADMYILTQEMMEAQGMPAYEISNHARPGQESRHNLTYWLGWDYIGIGPGAHGRITPDRTRIATNTIKSPERWLEAVRRAGHGYEEWQKLTPEIEREERIMMRLRLSEGFLRAEAPFITDRNIEKLRRYQLLLPDPDRIQPTLQGRLVLNYVTAELLSA